MGPGGSSGPTTTVDPVLPVELDPVPLLVVDPLDPVDETTVDTATCAVLPAS